MEEEKEQRSIGEQAESLAMSRKAVYPGRNRKAPELRDTPTNTKITPQSRPKADPRVRKLTMEKPLNKQVD